MKADSYDGIWESVCVCVCGEVFLSSITELRPNILVSFYISLNIIEAELYIISSA